MRVGLKVKDYYKDRTRLEAGYDFSDIPTVFEADDVHCGDLISFEGDVYHICIESKRHNFSLAEIVNIILEPEEESNDDRLKCPVCGRVNHDSWELNNEDDDYECGHCGAILSYSTEVTRTFYSKVKKMPEIKSAVHGAAGKQHITAPGQNDKGAE